MRSTSMKVSYWFSTKTQFLLPVLRRESRPSNKIFCRKQFLRCIRASWCLIGCQGMDGRGFQASFALGPCRDSTRDRAFRFKSQRSDGNVCHGKYPR